MPHPRGPARAFDKPVDLSGVSDMAVFPEVFVRISFDVGQCTHTLERTRVEGVCVCYRRWQCAWSPGCTVKRLGERSGQKDRWSAQLAGATIAPMPL